MAAAADSFPLASGECAVVLVGGAMRTRIDDFRDLMQVAAEALGKALDDGDAGGKHPPGSWCEESVANQIDHLSDHLHSLLHGDTSEDHLSHIICRAVMARALKRVSDGHC